METVSSKIPISRAKFCNRLTVCKMCYIMLRLLALEERPSQKAPSNIKFREKSEFINHNLF